MHWKSLSSFSVFSNFSILYLRMNVFASKFDSLPNSWFKLSYIFNNFFPIIFFKTLPTVCDLRLCQALFQTHDSNCRIFLITYVRLFLSKHFQQFMIYTCVKLHLEAIFKDICIDRRLPSNFKTASSEYYLFSGDRNMYTWSKTEIGQERKIKNSTIKKWLNSSLSIIGWSLWDHYL